MGLTKESLRQTYRLDSQINRAAAEQLKNILRNGIKTTRFSPSLQQEVIEYNLQNGFGATFKKTGEFVGFTEPPIRGYTPR